MRGASCQLWRLVGLLAVVTLFTVRLNGVRGTLQRNADQAGSQEHLRGCLKRIMTAASV